RRVLAPCGTRRRGTPRVQPGSGASDGTERRRPARGVSRPPPRSSGRRVVAHESARVRGATLPPVHLATQSGGANANRRLHRTAGAVDNAALLPVAPGPARPEP